MCAQSNDGPKLCECGCGLPAPIAKRTHRQIGHVKGQPTRFIHGHNSRLRVGESNGRWKTEGGVRSAYHMWLNKHYPRTGVCEDCGRNVGNRGQSGTHYAFLFHDLKPYSHDRADYRELCRHCHFELDRARHATFVAHVSHGGRPRKIREIACPPVEGR